MSGMSDMGDDIHDLVHAFADGELEPAEAEAFREHLGSCERCQAELDDILQLQALSGRLASMEAKQAAAPGEAARTTEAARATEAARTTETARTAEAPSSRPFRPVWSRRRRAALTVVLGGALAAAFALAVLRNPGVDPDGAGHPALALAPTRSLEARLSYEGASGWRPYGVKRSGNERALEMVPLETQAKLQKAGDLHGLATTYLLRGEQDSAAEYLGKLSPSPEVDSDRAVVALSKGSFEEALTLLDGVLAKAPNHAAALWNRGLVLRELGLELLAAESFGKVAALNEPGWSDEARERKAVLDRKEQERQKRQKDAGNAPSHEAGTPGALMETQLRQARAQLEAGESSQAEATLRAAVPTCEQQPLAHRCAELEQLLTELLLTGNRLPEARAHALRGLTWARRVSDAGLEARLLRNLGQIARSQGSAATASAYLQEAALREGAEPAP